MLSRAVAYLGGALRMGPSLSTDHNFYDGIFGCFTDFFLLKHQNLGIQ